MSIFQARFNMLFDEAELSQEEFGKLFGASKGQVFNWRSGRGEPDSETMREIAKTCNVSVSWLLGETNYRQPLSKVFSTSSTNSTPDTHCLEYLLEMNNLTFNGTPLTADDKEKIKRALELAFWNNNKTDSQ